MFITFIAAENISEDEEDKDKGLIEIFGKPGSNVRPKEPEIEVVHTHDGETEECFDTHKENPDEGIEGKS